MPNEDVRHGWRIRCEWKAVEAYHQGDTGWTRLGIIWCPEWRTGKENLYYGIVRRDGLRLGPIGIYRLWMRTTWPLPEPQHSDGTQPSTRS